MATLVFCVVSPVYQLMNEDLPAEWLPTSITFTRLRGTSTLQATGTCGTARRELMSG